MVRWLLFYYLLKSHLGYFWLFIFPSEFLRTILCCHQNTRLRIRSRFHSLHRLIGDDVESSHPWIWYISVYVLISEGFIIFFIKSLVYFVRPLWVFLPLKWSHHVVRKVRWHSGFGTILTKCLCPKLEPTARHTNNLGFIELNPLAFSFFSWGLTITELR